VRTYQGRDYTVDVPALVVPQCGHCKEVVFNCTAEEQIACAFHDLMSKTDHTAAVAASDASAGMAEGASAASEKG
jgi:hypothetical protein